MDTTAESRLRFAIQSRRLVHGAWSLADGALNSHAFLCDA